MEKSVIILILLPCLHYAHFLNQSMQLETVGLDMLNMDGTKIRDTLGNPIPTCELLLSFH